MRVFTIIKINSPGIDELKLSKHRKQGINLYDELSIKLQIVLE